MSPANTCKLPGNAFPMRPGDTLLIRNGPPLVVERLVSSGKAYELRHSNDPDGVGEIWMADELARLHAGGDANLDTSAAFPENSVVGRTMKIPYGAFSTRERACMAARLRFCEAIEGLGDGAKLSKKHITPVVQRVATENMLPEPYWETAKRWWETWRLAQRDIRALCPGDRQKGGKGKRRLPEIAFLAMQYAAEQWLHDSEPPVETAYTWVAVYYRQNKAGHLVGVEKHFPSLRTFQRYVEGLPMGYKVKRRRGRRKFLADVQPRGKGVTVTRPLERVELDWKRARCYLLDEASKIPLGIPWICFAIDCLTDMVVGYALSFRPPSYRFAAQCLKSCILFKDLSEHREKKEHRPPIHHDWPVNRVPEQLILDNEPALHSASLEEGAHALGCHVRYLPPYAPALKGHVEAFNAFVGTCFLPMLPGAEKKPKSKGNPEFDASEHALYPLSDFDFLVQKYCVDIYNYTPKETLNGLRPIDLWTRHSSEHDNRRLPPHEAIVELVGEVKYRSLDRRGIRIFGLFYHSRELGRYWLTLPKKPDKLTIRYDPDNISCIRVMDEERGLSIKAYCTDRGLHAYLDGMSEYRHDVIRRWAISCKPEGQKYIERRDLLNAKAELMEFGEALLGRRKRKGGMQRLARYLEETSRLDELPSQAEHEFGDQVDYLIDEDARTDTMGESDDPSRWLSDPAAALQEMWRDEDDIGAAPFKSFGVIRT